MSETLTIPVAPPLPGLPERKPRRRIGLVVATIVLTLSTAVFAATTIASNIAATEARAEVVTTQGDLDATTVHMELCRDVAQGYYDSLTHMSDAADYMLDAVTASVYLKAATLDLATENVDKATASLPDLDDADVCGIER